MNKNWHICPKCHRFFTDRGKFEEHCRTCGTPPETAKKGRGRSTGNTPPIDAAKTNGAAQNSGDGKSATGKTDTQPDKTNGSTGNTPPIDAV